MSSRLVGSIDIHFDDEALIKKYEKNQAYAQLILKQVIVEDTDPFVPIQTGTLKNSTYDSLMDSKPGIIYNVPYAHYLYKGFVMEDPVLHCAGFMTPQGWRSRKDVVKQYREPLQPLKFKQGQSEWFEHAKSLYKDRWIAAVKKVLIDGE